MLSRCRKVALAYTQGQNWWKANWYWITSVGARLESNFRNDQTEIDTEFSSTPSFHLGFIHRKNLLQECRREVNRDNPAISRIDKLFSSGFWDLFLLWLLFIRLPSRPACSWLQLTFFSETPLMYLEAVCVQCLMTWKSLAKATYYDQ